MKASIFLNKTRTNFNPRIAKCSIGLLIFQAQIYPKVSKMITRTLDLAFIKQIRCRSMVSIRWPRWSIITRRICKINSSNNHKSIHLCMINQLHKSNKMCTIVQIKCLFLTHKTSTITNLNVTLIKMALQSPQKATFLCILKDP